MSQLEADVVIVAAGASGLAASVEAAQRGLKVITLEKSSTTGGAPIWEWDRWASKAR